MSPSQIQKLVNASTKDLPRGSFIAVRGQVSTMYDSFIGLYLGLVFAMVLVYLLMVINFQSWIEPFIIITAFLCALAGIVWMLFSTHTTLSVAGADGDNHVHGGGHGQQRVGRHVRQSAARPL